MFQYQALLLNIKYYDYRGKNKTNSKVYFSLNFACYNFFITFANQ